MESISWYANNRYNGYAVQQWLIDNVDICFYISAAYLCFVFKGPALVDMLFGGKPPVAILKKAWTAWNLMLVIFSLYGTMFISPLLIRNFKTKGMRNTLCNFRSDEFYTGSIGLAMGAFAISKLPEFGDTFFLIMMGKRNLPFLSWFHHVTILLFSWYAYAAGSSIFVVVASMNYPVHTIMYLYFALAEAGFKNLVKPFARYITIIQIMQMVGGLYMTGSYIMWHLSEPETCSGTQIGVARGQWFIYVVNFYLFSEMFIKNYVSTSSRPVHTKKTS